MSASTRRLRSLLTLMSEQGAFLRWPAPEQGAQLYASTQKPLLKIAADMMVTLVSSGLIIEIKGQWYAHEATAAWLKRQAHQLDGFRAQHMDITHIEPEGSSINHAESPLAWLRRRRGKDGVSYLNDMQFMAGERLRADFTRAHMLPHMGVNLETPLCGGGHGGEVQAGSLAARQRVDKALHAIGPELSGVVLDVCCFLKGLEQVERERLWPSRTAKIVLGLGLSRLSTHYGMSIDARGRKHAPMQQWSTPDSRPNFDAYS